VSDDQKGLVMQYDISGRYLGNYMESDWKVPENCLPIDSNSVVGTVFDVVFDDGEVAGLNYYIGRFDCSPSPSVRYIEICYDFTDPEIYTKMDILDFCADPHGLVYIVPDYTDYSIDVLASDGAMQGSIEPDVARLPKTDEEIDYELAEFEEEHVWDRAYTGGYEPIPYHRLIALAGVDHDRNLWVRRLDVTDRFFFDVWDVAGHLAFTASLEKFTQNPDLEFHIDENGMLAAIIESDVYPRVYRLSMLDE